MNEYSEHGSFENTTQNINTQLPQWAQIVQGFDRLYLTYGTPIEQLLEFIRQNASHNPSEFFKAAENYPVITKVCKHADMQDFWQNFAAGQKENQQSFEQVRQLYSK